MGGREGKAQHFGPQDLIGRGWGWGWRVGRQQQPAPTPHHSPSPTGWEGGDGGDGGERGLQEVSLGKSRSMSSYYRSCQVITNGMVNHLARYHCFVFVFLFAFQGLR